jgi:hypothetical protein
MIPLRRHQRCHWHRWCNVILNQVCIAESAEAAPAVSTKPLRRHQQCHWHHWGGSSGVNDTAGATTLSNNFEISKHLYFDAIKFNEYREHEVHNINDSADFNIKNLFTKFCKGYVFYREHFFVFVFWLFWVMVAFAVTFIVESYLKLELYFCGLFFSFRVVFDIAEIN